MTPVGLVIAGCWQINYILANNGRRKFHLNFTSVPLLLKYINMSTVYLFYKAFCILKMKVALISCRWSKARSKAGVNNWLIRPPAESVPDLNNRDFADKFIRRVGVETQTPLVSKFPTWERVVRGNWADAIFCVWSDLSLTAFLS